MSTRKQLFITAQIVFPQLFALFFFLLSTLEHRIITNYDLLFQEGNPQCYYLLHVLCVNSSSNSMQISLRENEPFTADVAIAVRKLGNKHTIDILAY